MLTELVGIAGKWDSLGLTLDIPNCDIEIIRCNHQGDVQKCVEKMVEKWFHLCPSHQLSWNTLCTALKNPLVSRPDIAAKIERKNVAI